MIDVGKLVRCKFSGFIRADHFVLYGDDIFIVARIISKELIELIDVAGRKVIDRSTYFVPAESEDRSSSSGRTRSR